MLPNHLDKSAHAVKLLCPCPCSLQSLGQLVVRRLNSRRRRRSRIQAVTKILEQHPDAPKKVHKIGEILVVCLGLNI